MADIDGVAGIDAHKHVFTVPVLDARRPLCYRVLPNLTGRARRRVALLGSFEFVIGRVGVEGSAGLGRHVALLSRRGRSGARPAQGHGSQEVAADGPSFRVR